jgi:hypothetical protein
MNQENYRVRGIGCLVASVNDICIGPVIIIIILFASLLAGLLLLSLGLQVSAAPSDLALADDWG